MTPYHRTALERQIQAFLGLPYIWGGQHPALGFDCSGLVLELLTSIGMVPNHLDMTAHDLSQYLRQKSAEEVKTYEFGDIVFFGSPHISHVGFVLDERLMVEAGGGGSKTLTKEDAIHHQAFVRIRPISVRLDLRCVLRPLYP